MISQEEYIRHSLELNLFFLRLIKEHANFAAVSLPPRDLEISRQAIALKNTGERLLSRAITLSQGYISPEISSSGELVTDLTLPLEKSTQFLLGIPIDTTLTTREMSLSPANPPKPGENLKEEVSVLNKEVISATTAGVAFKRKLLKDVLECKAFSFTYPLMMDHIIREEEFFILLLNRLEKNSEMDSIRKLVELELNWNRIMEEHSEFIRGYLDPSEELLIKAADLFAKKFEELVKKTSRLMEEPHLLPALTEEALKKVTELRDFKKQGAEGIAACKIKSVIIPLLSDHVTREANHYIRLLKAVEAGK